MDGKVRKKIMAIMQDSSLTDQEKACKRQELMCGKLSNGSRCQEEHVVYLMFDHCMVSW